MSMQKYCMSLSIALVAFVISGCCCGPYGGCGGGFGGGCTTNCNDCEGASLGGAPMAYGPISHLNQMRKSMVCGGGCGEVYWGEWQSSPPDACDPCCNDQFVGGAVRCNPFCWRPGQFLFGTLGSLYGQRFCEGCGNNFGSCGCDSFAAATSCGDGCGCDGGSTVGGTAGCATCNSSSAVGSTETRIATPPAPHPNHRTARTNPASAMRRGVSSNYAKQPTRYR